MIDCINTKIENALKDDNIVKIMNKASKRFRNQLDKDTINTCQLNALWKTFVNHDPAKGAKFTTYLYNGVFIECMKEIKFSKKSDRFSGKLHDNIPNKNDDFLMIDILDELSETDQQMFIDRLSNMTISEMSQKYNTNRESTRRKMHKIIKNIQKKFS
ncbi:sigma-70 family RNA polymerase sigma factor [bacterium]|nr:sigma-70 family RNA polymerase sigma factor [bacterium]